MAESKAAEGPGKQGLSIHVESADRLTAGTGNMEQEKGQGSGD